MSRNLMIHELHLY